MPLLVPPPVPTPRHPDTEHFLPLFDTSHLPPHLAAVAAPLAATAFTTIAALPDGPELTACLRKLLEAKDCAVRARVLAG
ncbi:hypothetical protein [Micromonospora okii]|uniref:hypothetical protein n=1 Tax=Micromonospora okii TaxID=1182970 RepID=UPI001E52CE85|nr:hypothetical protein [Micromonospora okii]